MKNNSETLKISVMNTESHLVFFSKYQRDLSKLLLERNEKYFFTTHPIITYKGIESNKNCFFPKIN